MWCSSSHNIIAIFYEVDREQKFVSSVAYLYAVYRTVLMGATDRRLRRARLILSLASGYRDWAVLMLKKSGF